MFQTHKVRKALLVLMFKKKGKTIFLFKLKAEFTVGRIQFRFSKRDLQMW